MQGSEARPGHDQIFWVVSNGLWLLPVLLLVCVLAVGLAVLATEVGLAGVWTNLKVSVPVALVGTVVVYVVGPMVIEMMMSGREE